MQMVLRKEQQRMALSDEDYLQRMLRLHASSPSAPLSTVLSPDQLASRKTHFKTDALLINGARVK
jgi:hypothetical protein